VKRVYQTKLGKGGDCFPACIASVLELKIEDIPDFGGDGWWREVNKWLQENHQMGYVEIKDPNFIWLKQIGYHLICGTSPRDPKIMHAVVGHHGVMVHDPAGEDGPGIIEDDNTTYGLFLRHFPAETPANEGTIYVEGKGQKLHGKSTERVIVNKGADRHCTGTAPKGEK